MSNLIELYKEMGLGDENDLITKHLGDNLASLLHKSLHSKISYNNAKLEIEEIRNSRIVASLSEKAKNQVINMCDKALKFVELNNKISEDD